MSLRALAERLCDATAMTHLIDPIVADLQHEHAEARRDGAIWRGRRVRFTGGVALIKVLCLYRGERAMEVLRRITANDEVDGRAILYSTLAMAAATVVFMLPPLQTLSHVDPLLALYVVPQALPLTIPLGLIVGILTAFGGRTVSRRAASRILLLGTVCSALAFVILGWVVPAANYAYQVRIAERAATRAGVGEPSQPAPLKGPNELTLPEFRRMYLRVTTTEIASGLPRYGWSSLRGLWFMYHMRWALPCASLVFTLAALSVARHRRAARMTVPLAMIAVYWYVFVMAAPEPGWGANALQVLPPGLLAWLPNILVAGAALTWMAVGSRPRLSHSPQ